MSKEYWNEISTKGVYAAVIDPNDSRGHKNSYITKLRDQQILHLLPKFDQSRAVIDYGCGSGTLSQLLNRHGVPTIGLDISEKLLELAREHCDSTLSEFKLIDDSFELPTETYQGLITYGVMCYLPDDHLIEVLKKLRQSLTSSASVLLIEQVRRKRVTESDPVKYQRTTYEYLKIFEASGFKCQKTDTFRWGHFPLIYLIRYGLIPESLFSFMSKLELLYGALFGYWLNDYADTSFHLTL